MALKWIEASNYEEMSKLGAEIYIEQLKTKANSIFGLATGSTPIGFYKQLIAQSKEQGLSFADVKTFNLDEYVGIDPENECSYHYFMHDNLFQHIDIKKENVHVPSGLNIEEAAQYDQKIEAAGGIDIQLLGIGVNGHIGFNEPGTPFENFTHVVELTPSTREVNSVYFNNPEDVPTHAVTMGTESIMNARKIVLLISGESKQEAYDRLRSGEISEDFPASALHNHSDVTVIYTDVK